jgi:tetratricopeptide (TPR) repeat protein
VDALGRRPLEGLSGPALADAMAEVRCLQDDARAAFAWSLAREPATALALASGLATYRHLAGEAAEGVLALERAIAAAPGADAAARARAHARAGFLAGGRGDLEGAARHLEASAALLRPLGEDRRLALALRNLGAVLGVAGRAEAAEAALGEALAIAGRAGDRGLRGSCLSALGQARFQAGDLAGARRALLESTALLRAAPEGAQGAIRLSGELCALALVRHVEGAHGEARDLASEAREVAAASGIAAAEARALLALARVEVDSAGSLDQADGYVDLAEGLLGPAAAPLERAQARHVRALVRGERGDLHPGRVLCQGALAALRSEGPQPGAREVVMTLGDLVLREGALSRARALYDEALADAARAGDRVMGCALLERAAHVALAADPRRAAELYGAARALRARLGAPLLPIDRQRIAALEQALEAALGAPEAAAALTAAAALPFEAGCARALEALGEGGESAP